MNQSNPDLIYSTSNFTVERHPQPFISREEGGHLRIFPKDKNISCINDLTPTQAIELIRLQMVVRLAGMSAMNERGVPVVWVNLEDLGNWAFKRDKRPVLHIHILLRAKTATIQKWPEAPYLPDRSSGFYDKFKPLNQEDMSAIRRHIESLFRQEKFSDSNWCLSYN